MQGFLAMGGYAAYVWPAFAVTLVAMGGMFAVSWRQARRLEIELRKLRDDTRGVGRRPARALTPRRETSTITASRDPS